ncbi:MAG: BlaI/MecI/CopY family transcriptional regulator [Oscillospiraceae bacterium]
MEFVKLTESEYTVMKLVWQNVGINASQISKHLLAEKGWKKSSTYIALTRLENKGMISRSYPKYIITALVPEENIQLGSTEEFIDKFFDGNGKNAFACLLNCCDLSADDFDAISKMVEEKKKEKQ